MKVIAASLVVLALLIGIVPHFTDCEAQGRHLVLANGNQVPMKCHWTGLAEAALAAPLFALGSLLSVSGRRETTRYLGLMGAVVGVFVILLPTQLIGVCANPDMICNSFMRPFLILTGSLVTVLGLAGVALSMRKEQVQSTSREQIA